MAKKPEFWMCPPVPHRIYDRHGPISTGLFKVRFYGPLLVGEWGWYQASVLVPDLKAARVAFDEWVATTKQYIEGLEHG